MQIRLWGTRGSIPAPGAAMAACGGNTSCVEVRLHGGQRVIIDAGSGIRAFGQAAGAMEMTLLLSHYHWDHIQGFPFFDPIYHPHSRIQVVGPAFQGHGPDHYLHGQMSVPYFPNPRFEWPGICEYRSLQPGDRLEVGSVSIHTARTCHPQVTLAYRLEEDGFALVYMSDNEIDLASPPQRARLVALAQNADLLIHDCQYTQDEYVARVRWGHSTPEGSVELAAQAGVDRLLLFHHDPTRTDAAVEEMAATARALAADRFQVFAARDGDEFLS